MRTVLAYEEYRRSVPMLVPFARRRGVKPGEGAGEVKLAKPSPRGVV